MENEYTRIYDDGIFAQSQCIWHENTLLDFMCHVLMIHGYRPSGEDRGTWNYNKIWIKDGRKVVICLVDDIISCNQNPGASVPYMFDPDTVVITDNWINCPTQYRVAKLPDSFFGIYYHEPSHRAWKPERRFNLAVNRIDAKRLWLFLELMQRSELQGFSESADFVNFNCYLGYADDGEDAKTIFRDRFRKYLPQVSDESGEWEYEHTFQTWSERMPYRNHDLDHEQVHVKAWLNMVPETYSSDNVIALSEKTFRVLCAPVPWMLYSGRNSVARLSGMGFDVLKDVVDHRYDDMIELRTARYGDKMVDFIFEASSTVSTMRERDFDQLQQRCQQASDHNIELLRRCRESWPSDFARWLAATLPLIA